MKMIKKLLYVISSILLLGPSLLHAAPTVKTDTAIFAGGCFGVHKLISIKYPG